VHPQLLTRSAESADSKPTPRRWLRVDDAAAFLGIGVGTLNKLRTYGGGPPYAKLGHVVAYDPADLDAWASERKVCSTSQPVRVA
jgi:predicted DNA-binding transcriptional regulator AlpA